MAEMDKYTLPQFLDGEEKFFIWSPDEAALLITSFFIGLLVHEVLLSTVCGFVIYAQWKKIKLGKPRKYLQYLVYWYFPTPKFYFQNTPPSHYRRYIG